MLSFCPEDVRSYGRVLRDQHSRVSAIVEAGDATPEQLEVREVNSSIYVFAAEKLWPALEKLEPANAQGELYLTDAIRFLVAEGEQVGAFVAGDPVETEGVNTRVEMAAAAAILRDRINLAHMLAGVTIVDPVTTWIEPCVELEPDTTVHPFSVLRGSTRVRSGAEVGPQVVAIDAEIGEGVAVGPFCYLRPGTVLEQGAKAGTFVEIKNSRIGAGSEGSAPLLHRRLGDRRRHERGGGSDHRQLPARARAGEAEDQDRAQRPHRRAQLVCASG